MLTLLRSVLEGPKSDDTDIATDLEAGRPPQHLHDSSLSELECSDAVPWDASPNPKEGRRGYAKFFDELEIVCHKDGQSVIIFPSHLVHENRNTGEAVYDEMVFRADDVNPKERLDDTARIYEWLFGQADGTRTHPRIVHYMGRTKAGFMLLQRLRPGPMPFAKPKGEGHFLKMYWGWAMQLLTGLSFLHERGVRLGPFSDEHLWIREDFSIAIACLLGAGCAAREISSAVSSIPIMSPWHDWDFEEPEDGEWDRRQAGHVKADLVDWANVVFRWMTGDEDPLRFHDDAEKPAPEVKDEISRRWRGEFRYRGDLVGFRRLRKERLGDVIVDVFMGKYQTAHEVLCQVRKTIYECGGSVCGELGDELDEFEKAEDVFEVVQDDDGRNQELRLRRSLGD